MFPRGKTSGLYSMFPLDTEQSRTGSPCHPCSATGRPSKNHPGGVFRHWIHTAGLWWMRVGGTALLSEEQLCICMGSTGISLCNLCKDQGMTCVWLSLPPCTCASNIGAWVICTGSVKMGEDLCCHTNTWRLSSDVEPAVLPKNNPPVWGGAFGVAVVQGCASSHHDTYPGNWGWHGALHSCAYAEAVGQRLLFRALACQQGKHCKVLWWAYSEWIEWIAWGGMGHRKSGLAGSVKPLNNTVCLASESTATSCLLALAR